MSLFDSDIELSIARVLQLPDPAERFSDALGRTMSQAKGPQRELLDAWTSSDGFTAAFRNARESGDASCEPFIDSVLVLAEAQALGADRAQHARWMVAAMFANWAGDNVPGLNAPRLVLAAAGPRTLAPTVIGALTLGAACLGGLGIVFVLLNTGRLFSGTFALIFVFGLLIAGFQGAVGWGLIKRWNWARIVTIVFTALNLAGTLVSLLIAGISAHTIPGAAVGSAFACLIIYYLTRPAVVAEFTGVRPMIEDDVADVFD